MTAQPLALALQFGVHARNLRRGVALDAARRAQLAQHLLLGALALTGRPLPTRLDADPAGLVEAAVLAAREAGMAPADVAVIVNDALSQANRPLTRTGTR
ncbi:MAG TPA: hypothetical protein VD995_02795 [Azospirillum sp.]|nr:hypothetical protein [Azospirillum sp.]